MTSKTSKIRKILKSHFWLLDNKNRVARLDLQRVIGGALTITDRHTVSGWINLLLGKGFISLNPTSEFITVESNPYSTGGGLYPQTKMRMPNSETKYYVNIDMVAEWLENNPPPTPPSKQLSLSRFNELTIAPRENNGKVRSKNPNN